MGENCHNIISKQVNISAFTLCQKIKEGIFTLIKRCRALFVFLSSARCFLAASSCLLDLVTSQLQWQQKANEPSVTDRRQASNTVNPLLYAVDSLIKHLSRLSFSVFAFDISCVFNRHFIICGMLLSLTGCSKNVFFICVLYFLELIGPQLKWFIYY